MSNSFLIRNSQRIVHIPFDKPMTNYSPSRFKDETKLKKARSMASSSIGEVIDMGRVLMSKNAQDYLHQNVLPMVCEKLPKVHFRIQKCYALILTAAQVVSSFNTFTHHFDFPWCSV